MDNKREDVVTDSPADVDVATKDVSLPLYTVKKKPVYAFFKRLTDIVLSFLGLIILFVPSLIISLIIIIDSPGASPIFSQKRVGKGGKEFKFYKFRSMVPRAEEKLGDVLAQNEMDGPVFKMKDDPRITKFGKIIRKTSIDEIPQLLNVLKGDMSFVGPRPPLPREVAQYTQEQKMRISIKPGITCYWQIQPKRNSLSFDEWFALDLKYIEERSYWTDVKIFFRTFGAVIGLEGE